MPFRLLLSAAAVLLTAQCAAGNEADRIMIRTVATSAIGEAHAMYVHTFDAALSAEVGVPQAHPHQAPAGPVRVSSNAAVAAMNLRTLTGHGRQHVATFSPLPVPPVPASRIANAAQAEEVAWGVLGTDNTFTLISTSRAELPGSQAQRGSLIATPLNAGGAVVGPPLRQLLPGIAVAATVIESTQEAAVLVWDPAAAAFSVHAHNPRARTGLRSSAPFVLESAFGWDGQPAALRASSDGSALVALIPNDRAALRDLSSTLIVLDTETLHPRGAFRTVPGTPDRADGALHERNGIVWAATRDPIAAFGYATCLAITDTGASLLDDPSYSAVTEAPIVALSQRSNVAALAVGGRLETRSPDGVVDRTDFPAPIGALAWVGPTLYAAEAGRVHTLNAEGLAIETTRQLQSGRVDQIVPIPNDAWDSRDPDHDGLTDIPERDRTAQVRQPDSDGDGLLDGVDPDNRNRNAVLQIARALELHERAAGYEARILRIDATPTNGGRWEVTSDPSATPWLGIGQMAGPIPGGPRIRIDVRAMAALPESGSISVRAVDGAGHELAGSPATVHVRVIPADERPALVAWAIGDPANAERATPLQDRLAQPPLHMSHTPAATIQSLEDSLATILVIDEHAAAQSAVTRRAAIDFVHAGGGLLFIRTTHTEQLSRPTASWLSGFGVALGATEPVPNAAAGHSLSRYWRASTSRAGVPAFAIEQPRVRVLATGLNGAPVAAATHAGDGRVAVLASPGYVFDSAARPFATALFAWLGRAATLDDADQRDLDGDAVPDWIEDANGDGVPNPNEMNFTSPDTDGDGLPDGAEDRNRNGKLDAGETSATNVDTDSDGIWDGADATPVPAIDAPVITAVYPDFAPAHGGQSVVIEGRNFNANQRVWFADRIAAQVRGIDTDTISVTVPPAPYPLPEPKVSVRVEDLATQRESSLANAFTYTEPARVALALTPVAESAGPAVGAISVSASSPSKATIGRVAFTLQTDPPGAVTWGAVETGAAARVQDRAVTTAAGTEGALHIAVGAPRSGHGAGELVTVPWAFTGDAEPVTVQITNARVATDDGYPLQIDAATLQLP